MYVYETAQILRDVVRGRLIKTADINWFLYNYYNTVI